MEPITEAHKEVIEKNLNGYIANFETPYIVYDGGGIGQAVAWGDHERFYVYRNKSEYDNGGEYVQYCYDISYLDGWLYGAVQAACGQLRKR